MTRQRPAAWPIAVGVAAAAVWLYWPARRLPLIYDTLLHIRIAGNLDWRTVWLPTEAFGFYRPLTFLPLLIIEAALGRYPAVLLNALNSGQHALNAALLSGLTLRLGGGRAQAAAAGLLFAAFPFAYQAVAVYGHNVHPALVGVMLAALHVALWAQRGGRGRWTAVAALFVLALLTHEAAVLLGLFLIPLLLWGPGALRPTGWRANWRAIRRALLPAAALLAAGAVYAALYQLLPITRAPQADAAAAALTPKLLYLLQSLTYPWAATLRWVAPQLGAAPLILLAAALTALPAVWAAPRVGRWLATGAGWWAAATGLLAISLPAGYLLNGPRLLYLGGVGATLFWSALLAAPRSRAGRAAAAAVLTAVLAGNVWFVRARLADYTRLTAGLAVAAAQPAQDGLLLVNWPQWIAPARNTWPLGAEFAAQLGDYLFIEEWVDFNLGGRRPTRALRSDALLSATPYGYGVHAQGAQMPLTADWAGGPSSILLAAYTADGPQFEAVGRLLPHSAPAVLAAIGPYTLHAATADWCAGALTLRTTWSAAAEPAPPTTSLFAQLLDADGRLIAQRDRPLLGLPPGTIAPTPGWVFEDRRVLQPQDGAPAAVLIGVYDYANGNRYPAVAADGTPLPDAAVRLPIAPRCTE